MLIGARMLPLSLLVVVLLLVVVRVMRREDKQRVRL